MRKQQLLFLTFICLLTACATYNQKHWAKKRSCLEEKIIQTNSLNPVYLEIRKAFNDTLNEWMNVKKVRYFEKYPSIYNIHLDTLIFINDSSSRALLLLELQGNSDSLKIDRVQLISAERKNNSWWFYSLVTFSYAVPKTTPYRNSFIELSKMTVENLMADGLVEKYNGCTLNDEYINEKWFPSYRKSPGMIKD